MTVELKPLIDVILSEYALPLNGFHGPAHWARVLENALRLADSTGANREVVSLFAVLHDAKRVNESTDPEHGERGAAFALAQRGRRFDLPDAEFHLLFYACAHHNRERTHPDVTVQTCWDADRLDLGRVGMMPEIKYLSNAAAKEPAMIRWADGRASFHVIPALVKEAWGIEVESLIHPQY